MRNLLHLVNNRATSAKKNKKAKRGFTMAEAAVALTVIALVTVAALSLFTVSDNATRRESAESAALRLASDLVECFRETDNLLDFKAAVNFARAYTPCAAECEDPCANHVPRWTMENPDGGEYIYQLTRNPQMVLTVTVSIPEDAADPLTTNEATLTITATYRDRAIWDAPITFRKGAGAHA